MIRLGVIGHGGRVSDFIKLSMRKIGPDIKVVGILDPDEKGARSRLDTSDQSDVVFYESVKDMMKAAKPDALMIGTLDNSHASYAVQVANYDIPLFLEKPVAISIEQAIELERAFEKSKCHVVVSFPLRVSPLCSLAKNIIENKEIGNPIHILATNYVNYGTVYFDQKAYRNFEVTQGLFLQKATHDLDYMSYLMDSRITEVAAVQTRGKVFGGKEKAGLICSKCDKSFDCPESPQNRKRNNSGGTTADHLCTFGIDCGSAETGINEDCSSVIIKFASGAHGLYTQVFFSRRDAALRGSIVSGYYGTLNFDWYKNELIKVSHHAPFTSTIKNYSTRSHFGGDMELAYNFIHIIQGNAKSRSTIWNGIRSIYACLAAKHSAESGCFIKVRQIGE